MNNFKRVLSLVIMLAMLVPLVSSVSFAEDVDLTENWYTFAAKYSSSTDKIIAPQGNIKTEGYEFTVTENNGIHVSVPNTDVFAGTYPVAGVASKYTTPLSDLNVKITLDEESVYTPDGAGTYTNYSLVWSEYEVTDVADPNASTGICYGNAAISNGMRHIIPEGSLGLCIMVGNNFPANAGTKTASTVYVILYDGVFEDVNDDRPGYRWSFIARNHPDTGNSDGSGISRGYESIDLSEGLEFNVREDTALGYVVSVNGNEYYRGYEVGYFPNNTDGLDEEDYVPPSEDYLNSMTYAEKDIDMSALLYAEEGYVVVGAVGNGRTEPNMNYTIETINHQPAATWTGHSHTWGDDAVTVAATCTEAGSVTRTCTECGYAEERVLPALKHAYGEKLNKVAATCTTQGSYERNCAVCGDVGTFYTRMDYHEYPDEWTQIQAPTYIDIGYNVRYCLKNCGTSELQPVAVLPNPFADVADGKWYTTAILYCYQNGYMEGTGTADDGKLIFNYKGTMDRQMFATVLAKIDGADLSAYTSAPFDDVDDGKWYTAAIAWAAENEYASGIGDGLYGRKNPVTREQLALFFYTYASKNGVDVSKTADLSKYEDLDRVHDWALDAMGWAVEAGLISGTSETTLAPRSSGTRAEVSLIVMNFVENVLNPETPVDPAE